ncbi:tetratricopeptide repeat protein [Hymenobacter properus]|uniref:Tetratricopeptide repeat protein n=1 Tax=Hymenobacter properus TaxID=2791026 RepID=A0A931BJT1_9BACT|nr:tetratricopeptide repeat protein [Hymenobacter properus]MBF9143573.1 tetratricopeptide repeat protein [Hymenobacter properus]MBR7722386.1 tetratricopeptide repeat protein [Microvirga sp. SRT04]
MTPSASDYLPRVQLLLSQQRHALAAQELRRQLTHDPHDFMAHALLAVCLLEQEQLAEAKAEAELAIHLAPEYDFAFYALALIEHRQHRPKEALAAINEALALDPNDADYYHLLGQLRLQGGQWQAALQAAQNGLSLDAEHAGLHGLQARALARQGRSDEADLAARSALSYDASSSHTQAQAGWVALETNRHAEALGHFREALRLDPTSDFAREGLVEALKAHYWVYRVFMRFVYWSGTLGEGVRRGMFLGAWVVVRFVPVLLPVYLVFVFLSWFSDVIFESLLRFNAYGRIALNERQTQQSNQFLALLGVALLGLLGRLAWPELPGFGTLSLVALGLTFPLVGTWRLRPGSPAWQRSRWAGFGLAALGLLSVALTALGLTSGTLVFSAFIIGAVVYNWVFALR